MACWFGIDRGDVMQQPLEARRLDVLEIHVDGVEAARGRWASRRRSISSVSSAEVCRPQDGNTSFQYPARMSSP